MLLMLPMLFIIIVRSNVTTISACP